MNDLPTDPDFQERQDHFEAESVSALLQAYNAALANPDRDTAAAAMPKVIFRVLAGFLIKIPLDVWADAYRWGAHTSDAPVAVMKLLSEIRATTLVAMRRQVALGNDTDGRIAETLKLASGNPRAN